LDTTIQLINRTKKLEDVKYSDSTEDEQKNKKHEMLDTMTKTDTKMKRKKTKKEMLDTMTEPKVKIIKKKQGSVRHNYSTEDENKKRNPRRC
jgi:hypothetical protein